MLEASGALPVVTAFLGASLVLYVVLGGADFGAGILELFKPRASAEAHEQLITKAMGPVWEVNHVWLIIAVVILLNGFPSAFRELSIAFHVPLTVLLFAVTVRGCAFTFRHYDAVKDGSQRVYTLLFEAASVLAPLTLGLIAAGTMLGRVNETGDYAARYIAPWLTIFGATVGVFVLVLFAFVAAVFLEGETDDPELRRAFRRRALIANGVALVSGVAVFGGAELSGLPLASRFAGHLPSLACMVVATILLVPLHLLLRREARSALVVLATRALVAAVLTSVLLGWFALQYPVIIATADGAALTLREAAAPEPALRWLAGALLAGSCFMFPALAYLFYVFKHRKRELDGRPA